MKKSRWLAALTGATMVLMTLQTAAVAQTNDAWWQQARRNIEALEYRDSRSAADLIVTQVADAVLEMDQTAASLGYSVAAAGDVNGDGYDDVIVGAPYFDAGQADEGAAFIFHGSATGVATVPATTLEADQSGAAFGWSVAGAGDVNDDGYDDVIVGAFTYNWGDGNEGAAFVHHGSAAGVLTAAAATLDEGQMDAYYGYSVSGAGDVNGDGFADVIVGAYHFDNGQDDEGAAFVYHGSAAGIVVDFITLVEPDVAGAWLGVSVAGAGDVDADGYADVIVGAQYFANGQVDEGAAFVYRGSATGVVQTAAAQLESNQAGARAGNSVAGAGDVNGDGFADVIVGAYLYDFAVAKEGAAMVYHGGASGVSATPNTVLAEDPGTDWFGLSVAGAGDVNADGYADVVVGAPLFTNGQGSEGAAFLYLGSLTGVQTVNSALLQSDQAGAMLGDSVAGAGDVNNDGFADVIVGAYNFTNAEAFEGAAFVYHGASTAVVIAQGRIGVFRSGAWYLDKGATGWQGAGTDGIVPAYGLATDLPVAADVNGDGFTDVGAFRAGAWYFDQDGSGGWSGCVSGGGGDLCLTRFGMAGDLPVAGDWNGDGTDEVGVFRKGAWYFDNDGSGTWNAGDTSFAKFGLATDLPVTGDWNGDGTTEVGVFRSGGWYLDANGNGVWDGVAGGDAKATFGMAGDLPATLDWDADGITEIAVYRPSVRNWYLDDGSGLWEAGVDQVITHFGLAGDRPVTGVWR